MRGQKKTRLLLQADRTLTETWYSTLRLQIDERFAVEVSATRSNWRGVAAACADVRLADRPEECMEALSALFRRLTKCPGASVAFLLFPGAQLFPKPRGASPERWLVLSVSGIAVPQGTSPHCLLRKLRKVSPLPSLVTFESSTGRAEAIWWVRFEARAVKSAFSRIRAYAEIEFMQGRSKYPRSVFVWPAPDLCGQGPQHLRLGGLVEGRFPGQLRSYCWSAFPCADPKEEAHWGYQFDHLLWP